MQEDKYILVINPLDEHEWRDGSTRIEKISMTTLRKNAKEFVNAVSELLNEIDIELSRFDLKQVELTATATSSGQLSLVVGNLEGGFEGGIKFVFERKTAND